MLLVNGVDVGRGVGVGGVAVASVAGGVVGG